MTQQNNADNKNSKSNGKNKDWLERLQNVRMDIITRYARKPLPEDQLKMLEMIARTEVYILTDKPVMAIYDDIREALTQRKDNIFGLVQRKMVSDKPKKEAILKKQKNPAVIARIDNRTRTQILRQYQHFKEQQQACNDNVHRTLTIRLKHANDSIEEIQQWLKNPYRKIDSCRRLLEIIKGYRDLAKGYVIGYYRW